MTEEILIAKINPENMLYEQLITEISQEIDRNIIERIKHGT